MDVEAINRAAGFLPSSRPQYHTVPWYETLLACRACPARDEARRVVGGLGPVDAEILVVGQNPGEEEDKAGIPFIGLGGAELNVWLHKLGLDREKVIITNLIKCHTTNNRSPRRKEIETCTGLWLNAELTSFVNVQVIIPLGRPALKGIVGDVAPLPDVLKAWWMKAELGGRAFHIIPLAHPAYLLRNPAQRITMYDTVLVEVREYLQRELPEVYARSAR